MQNTIMITRGVKLFSKVIKHRQVVSSRFLSTARQPEITEPSTESLFTGEHEELRRSLRKIIDNDINPYVDEWEAAEQFPSHEVFKKLGDAGFLGVTKPIAYGGLGLDWSYELAAVEEIGNISCGALPMAIGVQTDMATPALARFGSDELKKEFLVPAISGDAVTCIGVSEPGAGSDVANIQTKAVKDGDDYVINGSKMWITNGMKADWMCLLANTSDGPIHKSKSLIILPLNLKGVHRAKKIEKMGMLSSDTAQLFFEDVRVPRRFLIGEEGQGFTYQMLQFQEERLCAAAAVIAPLFKLIKMTQEYTSERKIFGQPILHNQVVHFRLAELETEMESFRALVYRTVSKHVAGEDVTKLASMCKLKAGRLAREVSDSCLQYWGGMGYTKEALVSRFMRDFRILSIGGGADEVMLSIICKYMGSLPEQRKR